MGSKYHTTNKTTMPLHTCSAFRTSGKGIYFRRIQGDHKQ